MKTIHDNLSTEFCSIYTQLRDLVQLRQGHFRPQLEELDPMEFFKKIRSSIHRSIINVTVLFEVHQDRDLPKL
jgi:hypothetical protein